MNNGHWTSEVHTHKATKTTTTTTFDLNVFNKEMTFEESHWRYKAHKHRNKHKKTNQAKKNP